MCTARSRVALFLVALLPVLAGTPEVFSQPPDLLRSYELVIDHSSFTKSGGIAGVHETWPMFGTFGFVTGFESGFLDLNPFAAFVNEHIWIVHPLAFPGIGLSSYIELESLDGAPIPTPGGPDRFELFHFQGKDTSGAPLDVFVATLGHWLYMKGDTNPMCCDFFEFNFRALARQTPHPDFDDNGLVDSMDLAYWEAHVGVDAAADLDGNGMTDGADFLALQREFGSAPPSVEYFDTLISAALASGGLAASLPEPSSLALLVLGLLAVRRIGLPRCRSRTGVGDAVTPVRGRPGSLGWAAYAN